MRIWLLKDGENLPVQENVSPMRMWMLADALNQSGHDVVWWSSTHSHQRKQLLYDHDKDVYVRDRFRLSLLFVGGYTNNRSLKRLLHHRRLGKRFLEAAESQVPPDVIVVSFPILELLKAAVAYGMRHRIPVIVDVRDPWPDALLNILPSWLRLLVYPGSVWMQRAIARQIDGCSSVVSCSAGFLEWVLNLASRQITSMDKVFHLGRMQKADETQVVESQKIRESYGIPIDAVVFTFVGSFGHVYDLETVCKAASLAGEAGRNKIHVVLVGDGAKYNVVSKLADGVDSVTLTGWLGFSDVRNLLNASDVGLAPCDQMPGCVPNKVSEYSAAGLPILSSLRGDMVNLLQTYNAGCSYESGDVSALYNLMVEMAGNRDLVKSSSDGSRRMFINEFNADKIYSEFVAHIECVAREYRG